MALVSLSKLRDFYYCPSLAYLKHVVGMRFPPTEAMRRGVSLHSFYGDLWKHVLRFNVLEDAKLSLVDFVDSISPKYRVSDDLLFLAQQRTSLLWSNFGTDLESGSLKVLPEVSASNKELGLSGRVDFIYRSGDNALLGEVKTGRSSTFDELQLNSYMAM
ncbi:MAG: hypothetical protein GOV15_03320, partial [Candidatus Diapherotrites archaeon]|nr:hypothetical protein [Candidatus Diapherotrites archaeon]